MSCLGLRSARQFAYLAVYELSKIAFYCHAAVATVAKGVYSFYLNWFKVIGDTIRMIELGLSAAICRACPFLG